MRSNDTAITAIDIINKMLSDDFLSVFRTPFNAPRQVRELQTGGFPFADILVDKDKNYIIKIALAGVPKDKIQLSSQNRVVNLQVNLEEPEPETKVEETERFIQNGIKKFSFVENSWSIPRAWDADRISVSYNDGLLTIKAPYSEESKRLEEKKVLQIEG